MGVFTKWIPFALAAATAFGQLTTDQKISDFLNVAAVYNKNYGPYEWKRDAMGFDALNIAPWIEKISATKNDLDFYEVMVSYIASLNDAHDFYTVPSNFSARLNFGVDVYDGKLIVDTINRTRLPANEFPFLIGYELVSIDGKDAQTILDGLLQYDVAANWRSTRRLAAGLLTSRPQAIMPHAPDVPEISTVIFRRPDGKFESYRIPWTKSGLPLTNVGRYITPNAAVARLNRQEVEDDSGDPDPPPSYMKPLMRLWNCQLPDRGVVGFGSQFPIFSALPSSFTLRLGRTSADIFFSGIFEASGYKLGFIRIPNFSPTDLNGALNAFAKEIAFFKANTDGLVIDVMRNPGGSGAYLNQLLTTLFVGPWRSIPFEVRATSSWIVDISSALEQVKALGAPQSILDLYQSIKDELVEANRANRGRTRPIPIDDVTIDRSPARDAKGNPIGYDKPLIVLMDELTASAGDLFAATIQDNGRGILVGWRTMGAGGNVVGWEAGSYSLGTMTLTESLMSRDHLVRTKEYPAAPYIENIGVYPDVWVDYMTRDNLARGGQAYVDAFVAAMINYIQIQQHPGSAQ
jgi:hypothetical protein